MLKALIFLVGLILLANSVSAPAPLPTVSLQYTSSGYLVTIAVRSNSKSSLTASNIEPSDNVNLLLGTYTSTSLLTGNCLGFTDGTGSHDWTYDEYDDNFSDLDDFPYFTIPSSDRVYNQCYLSSQYYDTEFYSLIPQQCSTFGSTSYGSGAMGILGMGLDGTEGYYLDDVTFSIYLNGYGMDGQLIFGSDLTNAQSTTPTAKLITDLNFRVNNNIQNIQVGSTVVNMSSSTDLIFDINANAIRLPNQAFSAVINALNTVSGLSCPTNVATTPTCTYTGSVSSLPTITISVGTQSIPIPPQVYAQAGKTAGTVILNINELSTASNAANYVTTSFGQAIILDSHVMAYYYMVFTDNDDDDDTAIITMYVAGESLEELASKHIVVFIVIGVVAAIALVGVLLWLYKKKLASQQQEEESKGSELTVTSIQVPPQNQVEVSFQTYGNQPQHHHHHHHQQQGFSTGEL